MANKKIPDISCLRAVFENINDDKSKLALSLLDKAEFMNKTLMILEQKIIEDGVVTIMPQGSYAIERENPALRSYNTTIKNYTSVVKQIVDLLPESSTKQVGEDLLKFIASGKK